MPLYLRMVYEETVRVDPAPEAKNAMQEFGGLIKRALSSATGMEKEMNKFART